MTDLAKIEDRIVELCERAKAKGWRFTTARYHDALGNEGCALEACATELGLFRGEGRTRKPNWCEAARRLDVPDNASFGCGWDRVVDGKGQISSTASAQLGARLARRFVDGVG